MVLSAVVYTIIPNSCERSPYFLLSVIQNTISCGIQGEYAYMNFYSSHKKANVKQVHYSKLTENECNNNFNTCSTEVTKGILVGYDHRNSRYE